MSAARPIVLASLAVPLTLLVLLAGAAVTGRTRRAYRVLASTDVVTLAGESLRVSDVAARYQPRMYLPPAATSPPLMWVWYEAVSGADRISLVYHQAWESEISPSPTLHRLYSVFRAAYYGYPLYDIEYFQVDVSRAGGEVEHVRFETGPVDDYTAAMSAHHIAHVIRQPDGTYRERRETRSGTELSHEEPAALRFDVRRVLVAVQTWNHLSRLLTESDRDHVPVADAPLRELTDSEYRRFKFARKSQGDHRTPESAWTMPVAALAAAVFVGFPVWAMRVLGRRDAD